MAEEIILHHVTYSKAIFDNGILTIEKRTGGTVRHRDVPWSVFNHLEHSGNSDSFYDEQIKNKYPTF